MFRKMICVLLAATLCVSMNVYALNASTLEASSSYRDMVDLYFQYDFTIWGKDGSNISDLFYQTMSPAYQMQDYATIATFLFSHMWKAEATVTKISEVSPLADVDTVEVVKYYSENVLLTNTESPWGSNTLNYTMMMVYDYHPAREIITDSRLPSIYSFHFDYDFGDDDPSISFFDNSFDLANNGTFIDYSIDYDFTFHVNDENYPFSSVLTYHYEGTLNHRQYAEP